MVNVCIVHRHTETLPLLGILHCSEDFPWSLATMKRNAGMLNSRWRCFPILRDFYFNLFNYVTYIFGTHVFATHYWFHPCMFLWGVRGTYARRHRENMQTPHRKALLANPTFCGCGHRPRRVWDTPPAPTSSPGGNRTQDLLAVRRRGTQLRHRASLAQ